MEKTCDNAIFDLLRKVDSTIATEDKNVRVDTLIAVCILEGVKGGKRIIAILHHLDFNKSHVGIRLEHGCGTNPERHFWFKNSDGEYEGLIGSALFPSP